MMIDFHIRPLEAEDISFLRVALYHAIFVPPGIEAPPISIVDLPEIAAYIENFGQRAGDVGGVAQVNGVPVGAAWARLLHGYGYVEAHTPELSIALLPDYRGMGIGTRLMEWLLEALKPSVTQVSLSVHVENPAYRLYQRLGFQTIKLEGNSATMVRRL
jgi:[ribosomal protein S18]-alanine N-acetyltransferase